MLNDAKKKESVEVKNIAEQMIYTAMKAIKEIKKNSAEIVNGVEDKIADLKSAIVGTDANLIKTKTMLCY
jgi:molecular chaperone DnaK